MVRFTAITLCNVLLLTIGLLFGGGWPLAALLYITVVTFFMDKITAMAAPSAPEGAEFPVGTTLSITLGIAHFPLLFGGIAVISLPDSLSISNKALTFLALSLYLGQVSNSNAHELIHKSNRWCRRLGTAVYASILFGHHVSAHLRVHHVHAATGSDPNSARLGESFYRFARRAWVGSFRAGLRAENRFRDNGPQKSLHPFAIYAIGSGVSLGIAAVIGGFWGMFTLVGLACYAQLQLLLSDYVQHYGLLRKNLSSGKPEPVGPAHSWNAPNWFSSALMLNAPRHSDHHARPSRAFPLLELNPTSMPTLPYSLPVMAVLALWPKAWRRVMDPLAHHWSQAGP